MFDNQLVKMENNLEYTPNFEKNRSKFIRVVAFYLQNNVVNILTCININSTNPSEGN